jgi:hypothetical protein
VQKGISAIVVVVVIGLLGMTGCGGGDSSISKAEYEQQIEVACNKGLKEREELLKEITPEYEKQARGASQKELAEIQARNIRKLMAIYRGTTEELADVDLPEQGEKMAEELVKSREDGAAKVEADPQVFTEFTRVFAKATKAANGLGVASCGK